MLLALALPACPIQAPSIPTPCFTALVLVVVGQACFRLPRVVTMLQHGEGDVEVAIELDYADAETAARIVRNLWRVISIRDVSLFGCSASGFERIDMP